MGDEAPQGASADSVTAGIGDNVPTGCIERTVRHRRGCYHDRARPRLMRRRQARGRAAAARRGGLVLPRDV